MLHQSMKKEDSFSLQVIPIDRFWFLP